MSFSAPGPVTGKRRGTGGDWCCPGGSGPQGVCPEHPRQRSPPVPRIRARWRRFQGACPGCSITPPRGRSRAKRRGTGGDWCRPGCSGPQGVWQKRGKTPGGTSPRQSLAFLPVTAPGGGDTAPRTRALKTAPARAYARDWRGALARVLGADPLRPAAPRAAPVPASPSPFCP